MFNLQEKQQYVRQNYLKAAFIIKKSALHFSYKFHPNQIKRLSGLQKLCRIWQQSDSVVYQNKIVIKTMEPLYDDQTQQLLQALKEQPKQSIKKKESASQATPKELPDQIVHKVHYGDTLQGLSLQYSVPIGKIRYRNHIDGDSIYHLKQIIIPNPITAPITKENTQALLIEQFVGHMDYSEKSNKVAMYYLSQADWNMEAAVKGYKQDLEWERKNKNKIVSQPVQPAGWVQMKEIKQFYDKAELQLKKKQ